jgi:hypothetical protein
MTRTDWAIPVTGNPTRAAAITGPVTDALQALFTWQSGAGDPDDANVREFGMPWVNLTTGEVRQCIDLTPRTNASLGAMGKRWDWHEAPWPFAGFSVTDTVPIWTPPENAFALSLAVQSTITTTGSDVSNRYTFQVTNTTGSLNLFATAWGTDGTGGGSEIVAGTTEVMTFDQNRNIAANDTLNLIVTKTGSPTDWANARVKITLRGYMRSV